MTSKSPDPPDKAVPTPRDPPHKDEPRRAPAAPPPKAAAPPAEAPPPDPTTGAAEAEPLPGRPEGQDLGMAPMDKSAGPTVVPPAQTNAATAELSRAETRPAGRAAPEPDAADEPGGGGDPGDVHPAVVEYQAGLAKDAAKAEKEAKK